jgi:hypothetical protein
MNPCSRTRCFGSMLLPSPLFSVPDDSEREEMLETAGYMGQGTVRPLYAGADADAVDAEDVLRFRHCEGQDAFHVQDVSGADACDASDLPAERRGATIWSIVVNFFPDLRSADSVWLVKKAFPQRSANRR